MCNGNKFELLKKKSSETLKHKTNKLTSNCGLSGLRSSFFKILKQYGLRNFKQILKYVESEYELPTSVIVSRKSMLNINRGVIHGYAFNHYGYQ